MKVSYARPLPALFLLALLALAACDGGGDAAGGGEITVSHTRIALATVFYQTPSGPLNSGGVTVALKTGGSAKAARVELLTPSDMGVMEARIVRTQPGESLVRINWEAPIKPGKAVLRVVVKGVATEVPITFEAAPTPLTTRNVSLADQDVQVRPTLALPGTTETALASLGVVWPAVLTLMLQPSATATLAAPVTVPARAPFTATYALALRLSAAVAPGTTDTLLLSATDPSGLLVSSGLVVVRATAPLPAGTRVPYVAYDRALWPLADTTGLRNAYRFGSTRYGTAFDVALRADGRVFINGDTLRTGRVPGSFRAVAIGGALALDPSGTLWHIGNASGGLSQAAYARSDLPVAPLPTATSGKAVTVGSGYHVYATDEALYRSIVGFADGWVRDLTGVGGVPPLGAARVPSAPVAVAATMFSVVALTADGNVYTWGANNAATLGNGEASATTRADAVRVEQLPAIAALKTGAYGVIATDRTGGRWFWGLTGTTPATESCAPDGFAGRRCSRPVRL